MEDRTLAPDLRQFLFSHVASYDELDVLLSLQRRPEVEWTAVQVADLLCLSSDACRQALNNLAMRGLLVCDGGATFRYLPASERLATAVDELQHAYSDDRFRIVQMMTTNALDRLRAAALDRFGEAKQLSEGRKPR